MIEELKKTIKLIQEINEGLATQLIEANKRYTELIESIEGKTIETTHDVVEEQPVIEKSIKEESIDSVSQEIEESDDAVDNAFKDEVVAELQPLTYIIEDLYQKVNELCRDDENISLNLEEVHNGYKTFSEDILKLLSNDREENRLNIQRLLVEQLQEYAWANTLMRMCAYAKVPTFKYKFFVNIFASLAQEINKLYNSYGITIELPELLQVDYDDDKFEYNNSSCILIEHYCDISPSEYLNKVYDVIQVGYETEGVSKQKPVIFYYS